MLGYTLTEAIYYLTVLIKGVKFIYNNIPVLLTY